MVQVIKKDNTENYKVAELEQQIIALETAIEKWEL